MIIINSTKRACSNRSSRINKKGTNLLANGASRLGWNNLSSNQSMSDAQVAKKDSPNLKIKSTSTIASYNYFLTNIVILINKIIQTRSKIKSFIAVNNIYVILVNRSNKINLFIIIIIIHGSPNLGIRYLLSSL